MYIHISYILSLHVLPLNLHPNLLDIPAHKKSARHFQCAGHLIIRTFCLSPLAAHRLAILAVTTVLFTPLGPAVLLAIFIYVLFAAIRDVLCMTIVGGFAELILHDNRTGARSVIS